MTTVGVRELKNRLSHYLNCVAQGEQVTITRRGKPIGVLVSPDQAPPRKKTLQELADEGYLIRGSGKPLGATKPIRLPGKPLSEYVIEGRD